MSGRLAGKVAVITGGASGMGRATVLRFLAEGASVVFADTREDTAKETLDLAAEAGPEERVRFTRADVSKEPDVEAMIALAVSEFGRLDCVFNNAGIPGGGWSIVDLDVETWNTTLAVDLTAVFLGIKHGARVMREQGEGGSIISTASVAGLSGGGGLHDYSAAKAGVINLTRSAAVELGRHNIRVNVICPGAILTPMLGVDDPAAAAEHFTSFQPLEIAGDPAHIASAALFLASDDSAFVTGESLLVDGGLEAAGPGLFGLADPMSSRLIRAMAAAATK